MLRLNCEVAVSFPGLGSGLLDRLAYTSIHSTTLALSPWVLPVCNIPFVSQISRLCLKALSFSLFLDRALAWTMIIAFGATFLFRSLRPRRLPFRGASDGDFEDRCFRCRAMGGCFFDSLFRLKKDGWGCLACHAMSNAFLVPPRVPSRVPIYQLVVFSLSFSSHLVSVARLVSIHHLSDPVRVPSR